MTELLLMMAARADHVERLIRPALAAGAWVVSDRFADSSRVYQGIAGGIGLAVVDRMHAPVLGDLRPDLTILLDIDPVLGLERRSRAGAGGRFEAKGVDFHKKVRAGFLELAEREPDRFLTLDAGLPEMTLAAMIREAVGRRFGLALGAPT